MVLTPHFLLGVAIALRIPSLSPALLVAFLSHYLLDAIPHWDYSTKSIREKRWRETRVFLSIGIDLLLALVLILLFAREKLLLGLVGGFTAVLPDILTLLPIIFPRIKIFQIYDYLHNRVHWFRTANISLFWKITSQFVISITAILLFDV